MIGLDGARRAAAAYDEIYRRSPFGDSPRFYEWVARLAAPRRGERVLDIGCGAGGALAALVRAGARPIGLDVSAEALRLARLAVPDVPLVQGDGAALPFPSRSARLLFNLGNLEHFEDLAGGVREMRRVLEPDGAAWILLPNVYYSGAIWRAILGGRGPDHHQPIDRFATASEWRELLAAGGLRVERSIPYHRGKWWKRLLPAALAWHFLFLARPHAPSGRQPPPPLGRRRAGAPSRESP